MALETVTIVFTDLVGSTELATRIGPGAAEDLRKEHFGLLREACERHGGRVVKNTGDGLMLGFGSVTAALDTAVAALRAIEQRNAWAVHRFEVRVGMSLGEVNADDGDYFGEPVVQAARLCALAQSGQILATDLLRHLAGSASAHRFAPVGALELKGLPQPVPASEVLWAEQLGGAIPLPVRLRGAPEAAFVGRPAEQQAIDAAWRAARTGRAGLALLAGEPGIGKTRLASHHAFAVHQHGGTVLYGAVDKGLGVPYQPWIEALGHYVDHAPSAVLERYVADAGADLARLLPNLARRLPDLPEVSASDGETDRYLLLDAVTRLLRTAAQHNPVLVVIDDLHWADTPTLLMLQHLHRNLADAAVLFVGTYRDSEVAGEPALADALASLRREERVTRVDLTGLDNDQLVELLANTSGQEPEGEAEALAELLQRDTDGNPLFVVEVLRDLIEGGFLALDDDGRWGLTRTIEELPAPLSVRDVVAQRVERLGADAARVLSTAAVIGRDFELDLLARVLDQHEDELFDVIEAAMAAALVTESGARAGGFRFVHALIAQALVDGLSTVRRTHLHRQVAGATEALHGPVLGERVGWVAGHLVAAGDDTVKTVDYLRQAGRHALAALAPDEAVRWTSTGLEVLAASGVHDESLRCDLLIDLGEAYRDAGKPEFRDHLVAAGKLAGELGDGDRLARAIFATSRSFASSLGTIDQELLALMERAVELNAQPTAERARLLAQLATEQMIEGSLERRRALVDEALEIARAHDHLTLAHVLVVSLAALMTAVALPERELLHAELAAILPSITDGQLRAYAAMHSLWIALERGDRRDLDTRMTEVRAACGALPLPTPRWMLTVNEATVALLDGRFADATAQGDAALAISMEAGLADGLIVYGMQLMDTRYAQGRLGEMADFIASAYALNPSLASAMRSAHAYALVSAGRREEAEVVLDAYLAEVHQLSQSNGWSASLDQAAAVACQLDRRDAAQVLYDLLAPAGDVVIFTGATCSIPVATRLGALLATLGRWDEAEAAFARGHEIAHRLVAPVAVARHRFIHGRALLAEGRAELRPRALEYLSLARDAFAGWDCQIRVDKCEELIASVASP